MKKLIIKGLIRLIYIGGYIVGRTKPIRRQLPKKKSSQE